jgi:hypothetical protein
MLILFKYDLNVLVYHSRRISRLGTAVLLPGQPILNYDNSNVSLILEV